MENITKNFKYADYLWDEVKATSFGDNQVELFLDQSNILGANLRITNYGGGNTSCKTIGKDPLTNYTSLPRQEDFDIKYWLLEEAKLQRMPKALPLSRKVALVTRAGGGIGKAIADKFTAIVRKQGLGGDCTAVARENGLVTGSNHVGYGTAKAA